LKRDPSLWFIGQYDSETLKKLLRDYLSKGRLTEQRIRDVLLKVLLRQRMLTREYLKKELLKS